jgi:ABC-2 type transport system permease protein
MRGYVIIAIVVVLLIARIVMRRSKKPTAASKTVTHKPATKWRKRFLPVATFAKIAIRRTFRDRTALFFTFLFPLIFLFVFGGIFGHQGNSNFKVAVINQSNTQYANQFVGQLKNNKLFKVDETTTTDAAAREKMNRGQLDAEIVLPAGFGDTKGRFPAGEAKVLYTQNNAQAGQAVGQVLEGVFNGINAQLVQIPQPFTVVTTQTNDKGLTAFDYTFAGLLGFSIIGLGIFGPVNVFPELKKQGILRRLHTTPLQVWQYFLANMTSQSIVGLMTIAVMFAVAIAVFHLKVVGNPIELVLFIILSILMIFGIGLAVGGWASNERQAAPLTNIIVFPMLFLSGTFFPRFLMPQWLQSASAFLPLTPVIDGIRLIATEGKHLWQLGPQIGLIVAWLVIIYLIAFRVFRWE